MSDHESLMLRQTPGTLEEGPLDSYDKAIDLIFFAEHAHVKFKAGCLLRTDVGVRIKEHFLLLLACLTGVWMAVMAASMAFSSEVSIPIEARSDQTGCTNGILKMEKGTPVKDAGGNDVYVMYVRKWYFSWTAMCIGLIILWIHAHYLNREIMIRQLRSFDSLAICIGMLRYEVASNMTALVCSGYDSRAIATLFAQDVMAVVILFAMTTIDAILPSRKPVGDVLISMGFLYCLGMLTFVKYGNLLSFNVDANNPEADGFWPLSTQVPFWTTTITPKHHAVAGVTTTAIFLLKAVVGRIFMKQDFVTLKENYVYEKNISPRRQDRILAADGSVGFPVQNAMD